jgi:hypothetical protein
VGGAGLSGPGAADYSPRGAVRGARVILAGIHLLTLPEVMATKKAGVKSRRPTTACGADELQKLYERCSWSTGQNL